LRGGTAPDASARNKPHDDPFGPGRTHTASMTDLSGKHGLIVGVANKRSISWAIAQAAAVAGARIALTYPSERLEENVRDLAEKLDNPLVLPCDVTSDEQIAELSAAIDR
jgi:enoyl-[acyl-carrier protein] reductase I